MWGFGGRGDNRLPVFSAEEQLDVVAVLGIDLVEQERRGRGVADLDVDRVHGLDQEQEGLKGIDLLDAIALRVLIDGGERDKPDSHPLRTVIVEPPEGILVEQEFRLEVWPVQVALRQIPAPLAQLLKVIDALSPGEIPPEDGG